ncbi:glycosyltransferase family 39 protein [Streptomyces sp. NPDC046727]|uniref:glycosyltransferase family 39 protein n=1 Tax=Streptomyces sp. NPDC046727 TaxID=3155373 RepID=UPI0033E60EDF
MTCDMARRSLPELGRTLEHADAVHGLYYLLMHGLFRVFGAADPLLVLRLPSVLATAVTAGTLALLGTRLAGPRAGLLAGVVFALLPPVQRYAQEGRSYAVVCALVTWATYLLVRAVRVRTGRAWAAYAAVSLAACLLHEFAVLAPAAHAVAVPRGDRRAWAVAAGAVVAGVAPLAVCSMRQSEQVAWIGGPGAGALLGYAGVALLGAACATLLPRRRRPGRVDLVPLALPLFVLPGLLLMLVSLVKPLYVDRYVLYGQTGTALLAGAALDRLLGAGCRVRAGALLAAATTVAALLPVSLHLRTPAGRLDDVTAVAAAVRTAGRGADGVLYLPGRRRVWSLVAPDSVAGLRDLALARGPADSATLYGVEAAPSVVRARLLTAHRVVVLRDPAGEPPVTDPRDTVKQRILTASFEECATRTVRGARVSVYARPGRC